MVHVLEQPDFTLVIPGPEAVEWVRSKMEQGQKANRWEVPYFYSPLAGERGTKLRADYLAYLEAAAQ